MSSIRASSPLFQQDPNFQPDTPSYANSDSAFSVEGSIFNRTKRVRIQPALTMLNAS
jgi:hypothetical protein